MRVNLPAKIELNCPKCKGAFSVHIRQLHERLDLDCPFCSQKFSVYEALPAKLRRKIYYSLRDEIEHLVYIEHRKRHADYFDEWGANVSSETPDEPS